VISVAPSGRTDQLTATSNYGARGVQLAAPGEKIFTTVLGNDYAEVSGSSYAAAIVSGVGALALSAQPGLSVDQLRALLMESTDARPELRQKVSTGGRVNAAKAVGVRHWTPSPSGRKFGLNSSPSGSGGLLAITFRIALIRFAWHDILAERFGR